MTRDEILKLLPADAHSLIEPIPGDAPAGTDPAAEPDFHKVQSEISKLGGLHAATVDWPVVRNLSAGLLAGRAKDVRLAVWWAFATARHASWEGLRGALAVLSLLVEEYGEAMSPSRPNARKNQWLWLAEHLSGLFGTAPDPAEPALLTVCLHLAQALAERITRRSGVSEAVLARLLSLLEQRGTVDSEPIGGGGDSADGLIGGHDEAEKLDDTRPRPTASLQSVTEALVAEARARRERNPADESAYRLLRVAVYLREARFTRTQERRTSEAPPPPELRERLRALASEGDWLALVRHAETALERHPWWLDLHRWTALGLEQSGGLFHAAGTTVGREVNHLLTRVPALAAYEFANGTPFASEETRAWLLAEQSRHFWTRSATERADLVHDAELELTMKSARDLAAAGQAVEGLRLAMALAGRGADPRDRFQLRLATARLALDHRLFTAARTLLDALLAEADGLKLEAWEPALCARLYEALLECTIAQGAGRDKKLHERLYRIDPAAAVRFDDAK